MEERKITFEEAYSNEFGKIFINKECFAAFIEVKGETPEEKVINMKKFCEKHMEELDSVSEILVKDMFNNSVTNILGDTYIKMYNTKLFLSDKDTVVFTKHKIPWDPIFSLMLNLKRP